MTSQNALKHGYYCRNPVFDNTANFHAFLKALRREADTRASPPDGPPVIGE